ncbi:hypothetical protein TH61_03515 [Rufibacter sp. DG15C]|nr:hypothetical protein TH61_03515 [Rufibacter sp. DG15C]
MKFFDYIFYRVTKFFYSRDGPDGPRGIGLVSVMQVFLCCKIYYEVLWLFVEPQKNEPGEFNYAKLIGLVVALSILIFNVVRYCGKYVLYDLRWGCSETQRQRRFRGWLVVVALVASFILLYL